jgi:hypothetical protein
VDELTLHPIHGRQIQFGWWLIAASWSIYKLLETLLKLFDEHGTGFHQVNEQVRILGSFVVTACDLQNSQEMMD